VGGQFCNIGSRRVQKGFPWAGNAAFHVGWCFNVGRSGEAPPSELVPGHMRRSDLFAVGEKRTLRDRRESVARDP
jgi:hypothetical protein